MIYIKHAAIKIDNTNLLGKSHADIIREYFNKYNKRCIGEQGFFTSDNQFVDRKPAYIIALNAGQIEPNKREYLLSEDIWGEGGRYIYKNGYIEDITYNTDS